MYIKLINTGSASKMEEYYQKLIAAGWEHDVFKETRTIQGMRPEWDIEETDYYISAAIEPTFIFDLSEVLGRELIAYTEDDQYVIEIYDDWRE